MPARQWSPAHRRGPRPHAHVAFAVGKRYEQEGDLEGAVRWFRHAAEADLPDAALRLGDVLGRLADQRSGDRRDRLMAEAMRWLAEGHGPKHPDHVELVTDMLNRQQRLAVQRVVKSAAR